jgi:protein-tyrosine-phosphatase/DNA-binding transcriptional ArsR family regulator
MTELVTSDLAVSELTERLGERQSLVSYHLAQLRDGGLVTSRRSSADGRDTYYSLSLAACERGLRSTGAELHPALRLEPVTLARRGSSSPRVRALFVCTGNSARSQMAQAMITARSGGAVIASSAGSNPKPLHPKAVAEMERRGIDIRSHASTHLVDVAHKRFDWIITLCDRVREVCPEFPHHPRVVHWSIADPADGDARAARAAFTRTADQLDERIGYLLVAMFESTTTTRSDNARR